MDKDGLIGDFAQNYAEKVFYFCLKKTGSAYEAEDLASDIALNVVSALNRGVLPQHFPAWVWQIARNRYSAWARQKHIRAANISPGGLDAVKTADPLADSEDAVICAEQLRLLRRELSFISADYRNIVVAYYFRRQRTQEIARAQDMPEGTVLSRLHRARKILKEGMNMAREFGKRSYEPESISFCASGSQPSGLPFSAIDRKIPVNILCEAHNNPSTLQELALQLGIALPYMEEEVALLTKAELLKKLDNGKYITNFLILSRECKSEINAKCCEFTRQHALIYWQLAGKILDKAAELGVSIGDYTPNDAQMYFALNLERDVNNSEYPSGVFFKFHRADGGNWGLIGFEQGSECPLPSSFFNNNGNGQMGANWDGYQAHPWDDTFGKRRYAQDVPDVYLNMTLKRLADGASPDSFSEVEKENLNTLMEQGFCVRRPDGGVIVNAIVYRGDAEQRLKAYLSIQPEYFTLRQDMRRFVREIKDIMETCANPYIRDDLHYYSAMSVVELRSTFARLLKDQGLYTGTYGQFCAFSC